MTGLADDAEQGAHAAPQRLQTVAIIPGAARDRYRELLRALEEAFAVRFVGSTGSDAATADAAIVLPGGRRAGRDGIPCLILSGREGDAEPGSGFSVEMSRSAALDRVLRGQLLAEAGRPPPAPVAVSSGCDVLASAAGTPVWVRDAAGRVETASALPTELRHGEFLRDQLKAGRFWSLLPLVQFLRRIASDGLRPACVHRACFVIDDPNLRTSSYGYVRYPELVRDAREHGYHVAIATIPLDLILPGRGAARVFREHRAQLSLVVHGNDHVHRELERRRGANDADRMIAAAVARVRRFEQRAGVRVERVMCPPHGACSAETLTALHRQGFVALAASRPFPWDGFSDHHRWRLGGWLPAQLAACGFPVISRYLLGKSLDDLVFRAMLGQPLIVYCHHADLREGLEPLRATAERIAGLGKVEWSSLATIARGNAVVHEGDGLATVTVYSGDVRLRRPSAATVRIEIPRRFGSSDPVHLLVDGGTHRVRARPDGTAGIALANSPRGDELRIRIDPPEPTTAATLRDWRPRAWPLARRAMTETRDRALPLLHDRRR